ncbi:MAG TPA: NADH-quinone oxidoreductase subunit L, partial [Oculatellaceae cyanobacterium]
YLCAIFAPILGSALAGLTGRWLGARGSGVVTVFGLGVSAVCSVCIWHEVALQGCSVNLSLGSWFGVNSVFVNWDLMFDPLTAGIMLTVTVVSFCVHIYSLGYMQADPHLPRFLSYLSLFTGSMLLLVAASDLVTLLVGWEIIGVSSFLLIGFWFHRLSATKAAVQAVLVNRVSDTLLIIGLITSWWYVGSTDLYVLSSTSVVSSYTDALCLLFLCGALGKSAQVGLHVWLPFAMEGPTPVSALIHAATLVTAGIYLIARTSALWECSVFARNVLVFVGAVTSLMAATMGLVQNDMKRVIAYSTCSQLGYMCVALGLSHYGLAIYHLMTHACFKALLFLGAGIAIHSTFDVQDLRRQGGSHSALPFAWVVLLLGSLSLVGWPFLAGYYSKDYILELSWATPGVMGSYGYVLLMFVASLTSAYSFRVLYAAFGATPNARRLELSTPGVPYTMAVPLVLLSAGSIFWGYLISDAAVGWGTPFWQHSIVNAPANLFSVESHMIPVWAAWLPLFSVFLGCTIAVAYTWPLPLVAEKFVKSIYLFFVARWQFDFVWNQQVAAPVLALGAQTWSLIDKGLLEVLGPRGVSTAVTGVAVPAVHRWQTGTVHDYALLLQVCVVIGLASLAYPSLWAFTNGLDPHAFAIGLLLLFLSVSHISKYMCFL